MPSATERKALTASAFIASLLLFPLGGRITSILQLRERVPALMALALAFMLLFMHVHLSRKEAQRARMVAKAAPSISPTDAQP